MGHSKWGVTVISGHRGGTGRENGGLVVALANATLDVATSDGANETGSKSKAEGDGPRVRFEPAHAGRRRRRSDVSAHGPLGNKLAMMASRGRRVARQVARTTRRPVLHLGHDSGSTAKMRKQAADRDSLGGAAGGSAWSSSRHTARLLSLA